MKTISYIKLPWLLAAACALLTMPPRACALLPMPANVYYGTVRHFWENRRLGYEDGFQVIALVKINGVEVVAAQAPINAPVGVANGPTPPPADFVISVPLDDGLTPRYRAEASRVGEALVLMLVDAAGVRYPLEGASFAIAAAATITQLSLVANDDLDHDGISDSWESYFCNCSEGFEPNEDSDGDGRTNLQEWLCRSNPLVADECSGLAGSLQITRIEYNTGTVTVDWTPTTAAGVELQWADEPEGPFLAVPSENVSGTRPRSVSVSSLAQKYFRLKSSQ